MKLNKIKLCSSITFLLFIEKLSHELINPVSLFDNLAYFTENTYGHYVVFGCFFTTLISDRSLFSPSFVVVVITKDSALNS